MRVAQNSYVDPNYNAVSNCHKFSTNGHRRKDNHPNNNTVNNCYKFSTNGHRRKDPHNNTVNNC